MPKFDLDIAHEGLTDAFIERAQNCISERLLPAAERFYGAGGTAYTQCPPALSREAQAAHYFDSQPCAVSLLSKMGKEGNRQADTLAHQLFDNAAYYLDEWQSREGLSAPLLHSLLHLTLCYETLSNHLGPGMATRWRATLLRAADDVFQHFRSFEIEPSSLSNQELAESAVAAEGLWQICRIFGGEEWRTRAEAFVDAVARTDPESLIAPGDPEAPAILDRALGCVHLVARWRVIPDVRGLSIERLRSTRGRLEERDGPLRRLRSRATQLHPRGSRLPSGGARPGHRRFRLRYYRARIASSTGLRTRSLRTRRRRCASVLKRSPVSPHRTRNPSLIPQNRPRIGQPFSRPVMLSTRRATVADKTFAYDVRKSAFGEYIRQTWGWDESFQRHFHEQDYNPDTTDIITLDGSDIGLLRVRRKNDAVYLDQILILPLHQRRGYGTQLIRHLMDECQTAAKPLRLQYLKVNPVGRLYSRLGFKQTSESPPYLLAEWSPPHGDRNVNPA